MAASSWKEERAHQTWQWARRSRSASRAPTTKPSKVSPGCKPSRYRLCSPINSCSSSWTEGVLRPLEERAPRCWRMGDAHCCFMCVYACVYVRVLSWKGPDSVTSRVISGATGEETSDARPTESGASWPGDAVSLRATGPAHQGTDAAGSSIWAHTPA